VVRKSCRLCENAIAACRGEMLIRHGDRIGKEDSRRHRMGNEVLVAVTACSSHTVCKIFASSRLRLVLAFPGEK
jgi:hypothetical protein